VLSNFKFSENQATDIMANPFKRSACGIGLAALAGLSLAVVDSAPAAAQKTISDSLSTTYTTSPVLQGARAALRAQDEDVARALSGFRPTVSVTGQAGKAYDKNRATNTVTETTTTTDRYRTPLLGTISITQPVYRGGRTSADVARSENLIQRQRASLRLSEQTVLLDAATAYMNVIRDSATLDLRGNNVQVLNKQLESTRSRFEVGEVTRTDVAQAESRLAGAIADRSTAEGNLIASRELYQRIVGEMPPAKLVPPRLPPGLPRNEAEAQNAALDNPNVAVARFNERAARNDVDLIYGELLPTLSIVAEASKSQETQTRGLDRDNAQITLQYSMPLYQAGSVDARVRGAKQTVGQRRMEIDDAIRRAREDAVRTFNNLTSAEARVEALKLQIVAAEIALDGVEQEARVGSRTVLDVLNAEQELLNGRVSLVSAERDRIVAGYQALASVGRLNAENLRLKVDIYDPTVNYNFTRNRWNGTAIMNEERDYPNEKNDRK